MNLHPIDLVEAYLVEQGYAPKRDESHEGFHRASFIEDDFAISFLYAHPGVYNYGSPMWEILGKTWCYRHDPYTPDLACSICQKRYEKFDLRHPRGLDFLLEYLDEPWAVYLRNQT